MAQPVVLHVSPHPDDEILGAGGTLLRLADAGWRVINFAAGLGRPEQVERRAEEVRQATDRAGFQLLVADPLVPMSASDDLLEAEDLIVTQLSVLLEDLRPDLVMSPHEHDGHHAHELVGRATRRVLESTDPSPPWWSWGLWQDLPHPTLYVPLDAGILARLSDALEAYAGENGRNDYRRLLPARAAALSVLGSERVFGYGAPEASCSPYAELLTEQRHEPSGWSRGTPRMLDPLHEDALPSSLTDA